MLRRIAVLGAVLCLAGCGDQNSSQRAANPAPTNLNHLSPELISKPVLLNEDVLKVLAERDSYKPSDQFAVPFDDHAVAGKPIELTFKVRSPNDKEGVSLGPFAMYDAETQLLDVDMFSDDMEFAEHGGRSFALVDTDVPNGEYEAQNAFGAKVHVTEHTEFQAGVGEETRQIDDAPATYTWHMKLPPEQARIVSQGLVVKVFAVASTKAKHPLVCKETTLDPTYSNPEKKVFHTCSLLATITGIKLIGVPAGVTVSGPDDRSAAERRATREFNSLMPNAESQ